MARINSNEDANSAGVHKEAIAFGVAAAGAVMGGLALKRGVGKAASAIKNSGAAEKIVNSKVGKDVKNAAGSVKKKVAKDIISTDTGMGTISVDKNLLTEEQINQFNQAKQNTQKI